MTLETAATFDRRFIAYFAVGIVAVGMAFVFLVTFYSVPKGNEQNASMALGFVLGTLITSPLAFFYGASKAQPPATPAPTSIAVPQTTSPATLSVTSAGVPPRVTTVATLSSETPLVVPKADDGDQRS